MSGKDGYFDEPVAALYDESDPEMFSPARVYPVVDLLVELAGGGRADWNREPFTSESRKHVSVWEKP